MAEFFRVVRVSEALAGFRPERRTPPETVALREANGRVLAEDVTARESLPGFPRSSLDGYAVRARDSFGIGDGQPGYLTVTGAVAMGACTAPAVDPGCAVAIPTGGILPPGADAIVMVEHTAEIAPGEIEVMRSVAPGEGVVRADEDVARGSTVLSAGHRLDAGGLAVAAALGITELQVHHRPLVAIVSTGDEVVPSDTPTLEPGQVRDATATGLAALVESAGGTPRLLGIVPDDPPRLRAVLADALGACDVVLVSAGSSVGARDRTAEVVESLGEPGIWCHGLAIKPGKPTLLAECGGVPVVGLPGNPLSALIVFRLVGMPVVRLVGGRVRPHVAALVAATLTAEVPSQAGRLDVVLVELDGDRARPLLGRSSQLSLLARADGLLLVPEESTGLYEGAHVLVELI